MDEKKATNTIARFSQSRDSATRASQRSLSFTIGETLVFNPVVWAGVWFWVNGTCLFCGPPWSLPGHIFRFFVSCTGPEEIVPESTRGKRRKNKNKKNKKQAKKKKSREIWWNVPKKIFSAIREHFFFCERNPRLCESNKLRTKFAI